MSESMEPFLSGKQKVWESLMQFSSSSRVATKRKGPLSFQGFTWRRVGHFQGVHLFKNRMLHGSSPTGEQVLLAGPAPFWPSLHCSGHSCQESFLVQAVHGVKASFVVHSPANASTKQLIPISSFVWLIAILNHETPQPCVSGQQQGRTVKVREMLEERRLWAVPQLC